MSFDEPTDGSDGDGRSTDAAGRSESDDVAVDVGPDSNVDAGTDSDSGPRARLEAEADRAVSEFDESVVDLLAWLLDTETRARIYVYLRQHPHSTSEEVADGTGLYPSTVREALAELHEEETVSRRKRANSGAGNNPYEYTAIAPSELVRGVVEQVQSELNAVFNLDRRLGGSTPDVDAGGSDVGPVSITVDDEEERADSGGGREDTAGLAQDDVGGAVDADEESRDDFDDEGRP